MPLLLGLINEDEEGIHLVLKLIMDWVAEQVRNGNGEHLTEFLREGRVLR